MGSSHFCAVTDTQADRPAADHAISLSWETCGLQPMSTSGGWVVKKNADSVQGWVGGQKELYALRTTAPVEPNQAT